MESTKIQEYDLDPNCGFAKEESVQSVLSAVQNGGSVVKSVQRGVIMISSRTASATATINAVDPTKAVVLYSGYSTGVATNGNSHYAVRLTLDNSTTLTANRESDGSSMDVNVAYQVVEYY